LQSAISHGRIEASESKFSHGCKQRRTLSVVFDLTSLTIRSDTSSHQSSGTVSREQVVRFRAKKCRAVQKKMLPNLTIGRGKASNKKYAINFHSIAIPSTDGS